MPTDKILPTYRYSLRHVSTHYLRLPFFGWVRIWAVEHDEFTREKGRDGQA